MTADTQAEIARLTASVRSLRADAAFADSGAQRVELENEAKRIEAKIEKLKAAPEQ